MSDKDYYTHQEYFLPVSDKLKDYFNLYMRVYYAVIRETKKKTFKNKYDEEILSKQETKFFQSWSFNFSLTATLAKYCSQVLDEIRFKVSKKSDQVDWDESSIIKTNSYLYSLLDHNVKIVKRAIIDLFAPPKTYRLDYLDENEKKGLKELKLWDLIHSKIPVLFEGFYDEIDIQSRDNFKFIDINLLKER